MKTSKTFKYVFFALLCICISYTTSAQVIADFEGHIRSTEATPRVELYASSIHESRIEGWFEAFADKVYLSAFYDDLIFSVDTGGVENERMRILAENGNVGIGIDDPAQKLHVKGGNIMVQDGAFYILNGTQAVFMDNVAGDFVIRTPGPSGNTQFYIEDGDGHVGINTDAPQNSLHIKQVANNNGIRLENDANTNYWTTYTDAVDDYNFGFNGVLRAYIQDGAGSFVITSDERLKNSVESIETVLDKVMKLKPAQYYYNSDKKHERKAWGFLAQEVEAVFPDIVMEKDGYKGLVYDDFAIMSIKAIQEQQAIIDTQSKEITTLQTQLSGVLTRLDVLEN